MTLTRDAARDAGEWDVQPTGAYELGELEWTRDLSRWSPVCFAGIDDRVVEVDTYAVVGARTNTTWRGRLVRPGTLHQVLLAAAHDARYDPARCVTLARLTRTPCDALKASRGPCDGCVRCGIPLTGFEADELERVLAQELHLGGVTVEYEDSDVAIHTCVGPLRIVWTPAALTEPLFPRGYRADGSGSHNRDDWRAVYYRTLRRAPQAVLVVLETIVARDGWVDGCGHHVSEVLTRRDVLPLLVCKQREIRTAALALIGSLTVLGMQP